DNGNVITKR
ncbi:hypothetical protein ECEC1736_2258, partial [Escherichia coli EC1736]